MANLGAHSPLLAADFPPAFTAPGVQRVQRDGRVLTILASGHADRIVEEARQLRPITVDVTPVTLKDIFLDTVSAED